MLRATRSRRTSAEVALSLIVVALLLPSAGATAIAFDGSPATYKEVQPSPRGTQFTFHVPFVVEDDREGYVKVLPTAGNVAFKNGSATSGWWTVASLLEGEATLISEGTNGTSIVPLGILKDNVSYVLRLDVTVPPGALAKVGEHRLRYVLAVKAAPGQGSGGQMDPSLPVSPRIVISESAEHVVPESETQEEATNVSLIAGGIAAGLAIAVGGLVILRRKKGKE